MTIPAIRVGAALSNTASEGKTIVARTTADNNYMTFESPVGTDYSVPASKTLYITKIVIASDTNDTGIHLIGYGDTGVADGAAAPTTPIQLSQKIYAKVSNTHYIVDCYFAVPTGKFPYMRQTGAATNVNVQLSGIEV